MPDPMADPESAEGRAANGEHELEAEELFPYGAVDGDGVQIKQLVKAGHSLETTAALSRAEVPLRGGLPDPNQRMRLLVTGVPAKLKALPLRENEARPDEVTGWKVTQDVRVERVENVPMTEADLLLNRFRALLDTSPADAGALHDQMAVMLQEELQQA